MKICASLIACLLVAAVCHAQNPGPLKTGTTENLRGVSAVSTKAIWASGTHGTYLRTTDGGKSWQVAQVPGAEALDFRDVEAFSKNVAVLLSAGPGELSRIYATRDGGRHWLLQFTNHDPKGFFDCMAFWDRSRGIALGDPLDGRFELLTTKDGGKHWTRVPAEGIPPALDGEGAFAASGTCIAVQGKRNAWFVSGGKTARVFRSSDGGQTWQVSATPIVHGEAPQGIFSVAFRDAQHGAIAGGDYQHSKRSNAALAFTADGGASWQLSPISPQPYFSAVSFTPKGFLAIGTSGAFVAATPDATGWTQTWQLNLNAVSVRDGQAWAVGPKGVIVKLNLR